jgi:hypothetical protein
MDPHQSVSLLSSTCNCHCVDLTYGSRLSFSRAALSRMHVADYLHGLALGQTVLQLFGPLVEGEHLMPRC